MGQLVPTVPLALVDHLAIQMQRLWCVFKKTMRGWRKHLKG